MSEFIPIQGYDGYYSINREGEVMSNHYGTILKHRLGTGYPRVVLYKPGLRPKGLHIHRLLAQHFIPNPLGLPQVNHKDGDRGNFKLDNLEWCTAAANIQHAYSTLGKKNWNAGKRLVDRTRRCELCSAIFQYKRKSTRFCSTKCSAIWRVTKYPHTVTRPRDGRTGRIKAISLFEQGILKKGDSDG